MSAVVQPLRPASGIQARGLRRIERGALIGFCDILIPAWHIVLHDCKWFRKGDNEWVGLPSTSFVGKDGKTVYKDLIEFTDKDAAERFQRAALEAIRTIT